MDKTLFLEIVVVISLIANAILMNRISLLRDEIDSTKEQTEIFLNDISNRLKNIEKRSKK